MISLFSGAGGLDYGLEAAGFETAVAVEMDGDCCETLSKNRKWKVIQSDIFKVSTTDLLSKAKLQAGDDALLVGGPPCQPFSKASWWTTQGKRGRLDDPRAGTIAQFFRVLAEALPRAFVLENVDGLAFRGKDEGLRFIENTIESINERTGAGYTCTPHLLDAADFGVPQHRRRYIVVGVRDEDTFTFPAPMFGDLDDEVVALDEKQEPNAPARRTLKPHRTAWDALAEVTPEPDEDLHVNGQWGELLKSIPEGQNYLWHTKEAGRKRALFGWRTRYWSFLLKLAKNKPSWTISAQPGPNTGPFHWDNRRLSMRELCQLQTFPSDVTIAGSRLAIQKQVGNAVPSLLMEAIGRELLVEVFGGKKPATELTLLPTDRSPAPKPKRHRPVPEKYKPYFGEYAPHPGTGKGPGATANGSTNKVPKKR